LAQTSRGSGHGRGSWRMAVVFSDGSRIDVKLESHEWQRMAQPKVSCARMTSCARCGKPADNSGLPPYLCLTCQLVTADPAPPPVAHRERRRSKWPWLVVAAVVVGGGITALVVANRHHQREMLELRYPIAATPAQQTLLRTEAAKWRAGKAALLATLREFQPKPPAESGQPCPLALAIPSEAAYESASMDAKLKSASDRDPDESLVLAHVYVTAIADRVDEQLAILLDTADRARFHSVRGRRLAIAATALPLIVMVLTDNTRPKLGDENEVIDGVRFGSHKAYTPGHRAGTAYVFDKQTGKLRCAGAFTASSSDSVMTVQEHDPTFGGQWGTEAEALELDLEDNTIAAIRAAVHAVE
jgi:hypothetical protein